MSHGRQLVCPWPWPIDGVSVGHGFGSYAAHPITRISGAVIVQPNGRTILRKGWMLADSQTSRKSATAHKDRQSWTAVDFPGKKLRT